MSKLLKFNKEYADWIRDLSERFRLCQLKAATKVNSEMLRFYWSLGVDIMNLKAESRWGDNFFAHLSADLQDTLPGVKGFSVTNLGYIKRFYVLYSKYQEIHPQLEGEIAPPHSLTIYPQPEGELFAIPWGHHKYIIDKLTFYPFLSSIGKKNKRRTGFRITKKNSLRKRAIDYGDKNEDILGSIKK